MSTRVDLDTSRSAINVSDVTIRITESQKAYESVDARVGDEVKEVSWNRDGKKTFRGTFTPILNLSPSQPLTILLYYHHQMDLFHWRKKHKEYIIGAQELLQESSQQDGDRQVWQRSYGKTDVTIGLSPGVGATTEVDTGRQKLPGTISGPSPGTVATEVPGTESSDQRLSTTMTEISPSAETKKKAESGSRDSKSPKIHKPLPGAAVKREESEAGSSGEMLRPTVDEIIVNCPKFRILVMGKTGAGKSSLINRAFGVNTANVSDSKPGEADINFEISSNANSRFVLHDSKGFEPGAVDSVHTVWKFIEERGNMPDLKDKLHAVWLCFEIPRAGDRMFETGTEEFLKLKTTGMLGQLPVIAVFTKFDQLVTREERTLDDAECDELSDDEISKLVDKNAKSTLQKICIEPLEELVGKDVPHMTVSTTKKYENTLHELIKLTFDNVYEHVATEASIVTAIAQKASSGVKVDGSIAVGKRKYWRNLASSANFPGWTMKDCLEVLHTDIIAVWNFNDPRRFLYERVFQVMLTELANSPGDQDVPDPTRSLTAGLSMVGTIAGIVTGLAGPAAQIVIPIAASVVLAKWVLDVYQRSWTRHTTTSHGVHRQPDSYHAKSLLANGW